MNVKLAALFLLLMNAMSCIAMRKEVTVHNVEASPIGIGVPFLPEPFQFLKTTYLVYEVALTNNNASPFNLHSLDIYDADSSQLIKRYDEKTLNFVYLNSENQPVKSAALQQYAAALVYVWLEFAPNAVIPKMLTHKIEGSIGKNALAVHDKPIAVPTKAPLTIGSPFKHEDTWYAANGPSANSSHRKAVTPVSGSIYLPQRFAIDWVLIGKDNRAFKNEGEHILDWYSFGKEVVAVADGTIMGIMNNIMENKINSRAVAINSDTALGNYVSLAIDDKHLAVYAHLMINSVRVKVGQKVKKGQVLGRIGNTGNSDAPHLHLHICEGPHPLLSQGQAYNFDTFSLKGMSAGTEGLLSGGNVLSPFIFEPNHSLLHDQLALDNSVLKL